MRKSIALAFVLLAAFATHVFAVGESRFTGQILGPDDKPIANATITAEATEAKTFKATYKTDKDGHFTIFLLDGTIPYKFTFAADGYAPYVEIIKLKLVPEKNERTIHLNPEGAATAAAAGAPAVDPAVLLYNEAATMANSGDVDGAIAKLNEAIEKKPDLAAGYIALTRLYGQKQDWKHAIEVGNKALEFDPEESSVLSVLADAYDKTGDKAKAAEYRKKAPANPTWLFNEAAKAINAGNDSAAQPLLEQAVKADDTFSQAHYELGMVYVRLGKNAEAKTELSRYLELEPNGKDAATAKEMMKYIK
ncbi:MAG: tetratricopeptide repeat protein [Thermoanaerobaculia bacterium]